MLIIILFIVITIIYTKYKDIKKLYNNNLKKKYIIYSSDNNTSTFILVNKILEQFKEKYKFNYTLENKSTSKNFNILEKISNSNNNSNNIHEYLGIYPEYFFIKNYNSNIRFLIKTNKMYLFLLTKHSFSQNINIITDIKSNSTIYITNNNTISYKYFEIICEFNNIEIVELNSKTNSNNYKIKVNIEYINGDKIAIKYNELKENEYIFLVDSLDTQIISVLNYLYKLKYISLFSEINFFNKNKNEEKYLLKRINISNYNTTTTIFKHELIKDKPKVNTYYYSNILFCNKSIYNELAHYITKIVFDMKLNEEIIIKNKEIKIHEGVFDFYKNNNIISFSKPEPKIEEYNSNNYNNFKKVDIINDNLF